MKTLLVGLLLLALGAALPVWLLGDRRPAPAKGRPSSPQRALIAHDDSGNQHDAIIQGDVITGLPGHKGLSFSFDVDGTWLLVPPTPDLNPGFRDFLVDAWVQFDEAPGRTGTFDIIRKGLSDTPTGEFKLEILARDRIKCSFKDEARVRVYVIATGLDVMDHAWHQVGCARVGMSWHAIVDGEIFSKSATLGSIANTVPLSIGSKYGLEDVPQGRVDEVRYFAASADTASRGTGTPTGAKAAAAVKKLAHAPAVAIWHLDDGRPRAVSASGR